jgi:hypothetical protein
VFLPQATTSSLEALSAYAESQRVVGTTRIELLKQAVELIERNRPPADS